MPFIENHARLLRILGSPFTPLYYLATVLRNRAYDKQWLTSRSFPFPVICVGNLCAGGSGKTPMTEYLLRLFLPDYAVGVVSRGYGRRTRYDFLAQPEMDASEVGDEPMQYLRKFSDEFPEKFSLYLASRRENGIEALKQLKPNLDMILLDDAYQHRTVRAGLNILLSEFSNPFFKDYLLPLGTLRESRSGCRRAQIIVFTKCPVDLDKETARKYVLFCEKYFSKGKAPRVYFTALDYSMPQLEGSLGGLNEKHNGIRPSLDSGLCPGRRVILFTGIAHPETMEAYIRSKGCEVVKHFRFGDHYSYTPADMQKLGRAAEAASAWLLTTEKDYSRLLSAGTFDYLCHLPLAYLPVRPRILLGQEKEFEAEVREYIRFGCEIDSV